MFRADRLRLDCAVTEYGVAAHASLGAIQLVDKIHIGEKITKFDRNCTEGVAPVAERLRALFLNHSYHLTAVSGVGSSPALATCETSQVLLVGVQGGFSWGSPVFAHLLIGPSYMG